MATDGQFRVVCLPDLDVTLGTVTERSDGFLSVHGPKARSIQRVERHGLTQAECICFEYGGVSRDTAPLNSGRIVTQIGLKLLAMDSCNLCYVMWRIEPVEEIVVSIKRNPGRARHVECGSGGYTILSRQRVGQNESIPSARDGRQHSLQAEIEKSSRNEYRIIVSADRSRLMIPVPEKYFSGLTGPPGFRSDNGVFTFRLYTRGGWLL